MSAFTQADVAAFGDALAVHIVGPVTLGSVTAAVQSWQAAEAKVIEDSNARIRANMDAVVAFLVGTYDEFRTEGSGVSDEQWTTGDVAEHLGIKRDTVASYRSRGQMPEPDRYTGRTPWWHPETIRAWRPKGDK